MFNVFALAFCSFLLGTSVAMGAHAVVIVIQGVCVAANAYWVNELLRK